MAIHARPADTVTDGGETDTLDSDTSPDIDTPPQHVADSDIVQYPDDFEDLEEFAVDATGLEGPVRRRWRPRTPVGCAAAAGVVMVLVVAGLTGWLAVAAQHSNTEDRQRRAFLDAGRQGAINLTTIDYRHVDTDVQRILDSATGQFYDDFSKRSQPFVDVVKQVQSTSEGTVTAAGIESETPDGAEVLVAVTVKTSNPGAPEQDPRSWRMRVTVNKVGDQAKVANVAFVP